jgi:hypothetical protein
LPSSRTTWSSKLSGTDTLVTDIRSEKVIYDNKILTVELNPCAMIFLEILEFHCSQTFVFSKMSLPDGMKLCRCTLHMYSQGSEPVVLDGVSGCDQFIVRDPESLLHQGTLYLRRGKLIESVVVLTRALELDPLNFYCLSTRAIVYAFMGEWADVKHDTMKAIEMEQLCLLPRIYFIKSCFHLSEFYTAWLCLSASLHLFPHSTNLSHIWRRYHGCFDCNQPMDSDLLSPDLLADPCLDLKLHSIDDMNSNEQVQFVHFARVPAPIVECEAYPPPLRFF